MSPRQIVDQRTIDRIKDYLDVDADIELIGITEAEKNNKPCVQIVGYRKGIRQFARGMSLAAFADMAV